MLRPKRALPAFPSRPHASNFPEQFQSLPLPSSQARPRRSHSSRALFREPASSNAASRQLGAPPLPACRYCLSSSPSRRHEALALPLLPSSGTSLLSSTVRQSRSIASSGCTAGVNPDLLLPPFPRYPSNSRMQRSPIHIHGAGVVDTTSSNHIDLVHGDRFRRNYRRSWNEHWLRSRNRHRPRA